MSVSVSESEKAVAFCLRSALVSAFVRAFVRERVAGFLGSPSAASSNNSFLSLVEESNHFGDQSSQQVSPQKGALSRTHQ